MQTGSSNILVVDDEPQVCALIREELAERGLRCRTTTQPQQAKLLLDSQPFRLLIADILMPGISGLDLLAYVKGHVPDCRVILVTGHSRREHVAQALLLGAYDYIEKPFEGGELAAMAAGAIHNAKAELPQLPLRAAAAMEGAQTKQASLESVRALVRAVEAKDPYTRRHSEHVAHYAVHLAKATNASRAVTESVQVASLLHDVGKIGVPDHILTKPGRLTEEEVAKVRRHPVLGEAILTNITVFKKEAQLVRHHHERWDGKGYPDGLAGEESPLGARIIMAADCMDAMLMDRIYKTAYPVEKMLGELARCAGTQFDPKIAAAAIAWCQSHREALFLPGKAAPARQEVA